MMQKSKTLRCKLNRICIRDDLEEKKRSCKRRRIEPKGASSASSFDLDTGAVGSQGSSLMSSTTRDSFNVDALFQAIPSTASNNCPSNSCSLPFPIIAWDFDEDDNISYGSNSSCNSDDLVVPREPDRKSNRVTNQARKVQQNDVL